jgi:hypothetical protein
MLQRLHNFIREELRKERSGFLKGSTITEAINSASVDLWRAKINKMKAGAGEDFLLQPFKGSDTLTDAGSYTLTDGAEYELIAIEPTSESLIQIMLAGNDIEFTGAALSSEYKHISKSDRAYTINAASEGLAALPDDLFSVGQSFYHDFEGTVYEGLIMEDREFIDRKNSAIVPASTSKPIARLHDNQIEFYPVPSGADTYDFILPYTKFNPVARVYTVDNDLLLQFRPASYDEDVRVYYMRPPVQARATYGTVTAGVVPLTTTTELEWADAAFSELAARALVYLGASISNQLAMQIEPMTAQNNQIDANN